MTPADSDPLTWVTLTTATHAVSGTTETCTYLGPLGKRMKAPSSLCQVAEATKADVPPRLDISLQPIDVLQFVLLGPSATIPD